jgi:hypothetical protein
VATARADGHGTRLERMPAHGNPRRGSPEAN